ncbi:MAG: glycoside hydrolase family 3 protein [Candidatus Eisenbacteria bacterium]|nr:glycoside hydrolase family 3 protein [Candidatus Eisenbacteria bacterium]
MTDRFLGLAGRLVMAAPAGRSLLVKEEAILRRGGVGHLILFRRNMRDQEEVGRLTARAARLLPRPPLIATDQEGGLVSEARAVAGVPPAPMRLGAAGDEGAAEAWARESAARLREIGVGMALAPVLDVVGPGGGAVIGTRAYGGRPGLVARMGAAAVRGALLGGVLPVGKHFPGHGGVRADSHTGLPADRRTGDLIRRRDLVPFHAAIRAGLPAVMIAHVAYPGLGTGRRPATLSEEVIGGLLRRQLGFRGIVMSDALEMAGFPGMEGVVPAFRAGIDLFCAGRSLAQGERVAGLLARAMREGRIDPEEAGERGERIERLRDGLPAASSPPRRRPPFPEARGIVRARGRGPFRPFPAEGGILFLPKRLEGRIGLPVDPGEAVRGAGAVRVVRYPFDPSPGEVRVLLREAGRVPASAVGILGRGEPPAGQLRLLRGLAPLPGRLLPVALLDPEPLLRAWPGEALLTFGFEPEALVALLRVLSGKSRPAGTSPLAIR